jgi:hypothetical protein
VTTGTGGWLHAAFAADADALQRLAEDGVAAEDIERGRLDRLGLLGHRNAAELAAPGHTLRSARLTRWAFAARVAQRIQCQ